MDDLSSNDSESQTFDTFTLKERNSILEQENLALKTQIDDAVNITNKIDLLQKQNLELSQELINLRTVNDNLNCRLQISLQTNADLSKSLESAKTNFTAQIQNDRLSAQTEATKLKEKYKAHNDQIYGELSQIKAQNDELQVNQKVFTNKIQHVLEAAAAYFTTKFTTLDDLTSFFKQVPPMVINEPEQNSKPKNIGSEDMLQSSDLLKLVKSLKKKLKIVKNEMQKTETKYQDLQLSTNREISTLQRKLEFFEKDKTENDSNYEITIKDLNRQLTETKETLESTKQELKKAKQAQTKIDLPVRLPDHIPTQYYEPPEKVAETRQRDKTDVFQIESLQSRISDLTSDLTNYQNRQTELQDQKRKLEVSLQSAEMKLTKLSNDHKSLQIVHNESLSEIETLRKSLHEKKTIMNNSKPVPIVIQETTNKKELLRKESRIVELTSEVHKKEAEIESLSAKIFDLENSLSNSETEYKKLKEEHREYVIRSESKRPLTADDIVPPGSFRYSKFDSTLSRQIDEIASNNSLQIPSKIEHIFRCIDDFYTGKITEIEKICEETVERSTILKNRLKQHITNISIDLTGQPLPFENNSNNNSNDPCDNRFCCSCCASLFENLQKIEDIVRNLINEKNNLIHIKETLESQLSQVSIVLETDDIIGKAGELKGQIFELSKRLLFLKKKHKNLIKVKKDENEKQKIELMNLKSEVELRETTTSQLEEKLKAQTEVVKKLRSENRRLEENLKETLEAKNELESTLTENAESNLITMNTKYKSLEDQLKREKVKQEEIYEEHQKNQKTSEVKIEGLVTENRQLSMALSKLREEKEEQLRENERQIKSMQEKFRETEKNLKNSYDQIITEMKNQNEETRKDIEELSRAVSKKEREHDDLEKKLKSAQHQKEKAHQELMSLRSQFSREKKLSDAKNKSEICSLKTKYKEKIEILKSKSKEDQQKMVLYVVDVFRTVFCNFLGNMEDKPFKILIDRLKEKYDRLNETDQSIRRMLNVSERQTTEDAVAQLLINH